jgi:predicted ribosomally synthesized peptide with SipW-like signal peptide
MNATLKRPLAMFGGGLAAIGAVGVLTLGATLSLFSDSDTSASNTFVAGTVEVGPDGASTTCTVGQIMPGDSSANFGSGSGGLTPCAYNVVYTGTAAAWLAVDVLINGGTPNLFTGLSDGLQFRVLADGTTSIVNGTSFADSAGSSATVVSGSTVSDILVSGTPAVTNDTVQFNIDYLLPLLAANSLQGGTADITLTFHAVQSANQPIGSCQAGRQCLDITWG